VIKNFMTELGVKVYGDMTLRMNSTHRWDMIDHTQWVWQIQDRILMEVSSLLRQCLRYSMIDLI
jgi:hypothetical protein